ncbi:hypothetical protein WN982_30335 [Paraburkholderia sp. IMGN_8]|uniref:hypothetical protein n=1 Tax=Paraburkholderia sp. IMGN_8 TaxID=3136564 RepID=UPI003101A529
MTTSGTITMTMREVDRLRTIQSVVDGMLMTRQAAERLQLSRRQVDFDAYTLIADNPL